MLTASRIIELLHLEPLPVEGGYFCETYRAAETLDRPALPGRYEGTPFDDPDDPVGINRPPHFP